MSDESPGFLKKHPALVPGVAAAVMLLTGLAKWPEGFYMSLRMVVFAAAIWVAIAGRRAQVGWAVGVFGFIAIVFNPLVPVELSSSAWCVTVTIAASVFVLAIFSVVPRAADDEAVELLAGEEELLDEDDI